MHYLVEEEGAAATVACVAFVSLLLASMGSPSSSLSESTMSTIVGFLTTALDVTIEDEGAVAEEEGMSCLAFFFTAASCFSFINTTRCFSFLVMTAAFFFNPGGAAGAAGMAFFLKASVFSNPGGGSPPPSPLPRMRNGGRTSPSSHPSGCAASLASSSSTAVAMGTDAVAGWGGKRSGGGCTCGGEGERGVERREAEVNARAACGGEGVREVKR